MIASQTRPGWIRTTVALSALAGGLGAQIPVPPPAAQNPSPMVEHSRAHTRLEQRELPGVRRSFDGPLNKPVAVFMPAKVRPASPVHLVVHFHGAAFVAEHAVSRVGGNYVTAVVNLGAGSGVYERTFSDAAVLDSLVAAVARGLSVKIATTTLTGFSAGYGAVRAILRDSGHFRRVNSVLLLDGLHTSYVPPETVLAKGGALDTANLDVFARFARAAMRGEKRFVITHSEIFPGTFGSTTETTDFLVNTLGLRRTAVLRWGPGGMQQLSEVRSRGLELLGFAGNTGPDHIDHFHGMPAFLERVLARR